MIEQQLPLFGRDAQIRTIARTGSIEEDFKLFHAANPHVFSALEQLADRYSRGARIRVGMKFLYEALRQEGRIATNGAPFKLDNRFTSHYARALIAAHPELEDVIEIRVLRPSRSYRVPRKAHNR